MRWFTAAFFLFALPVQADVFLLRHAEAVSDESADPTLSSLGEQRARNVAQLLQEEKPNAVYTTEFARARATANAIAEAAGIDSTTYDPRDPAKLVETLRNSVGNQVVVGHSNTLPTLVHALGGDPGADIDHGEYDRVYRLRKTDSGVATSVFQSRPKHQRPAPEPFQIEPDRIANETLVYAMSLNGAPAGTSSWRYERDGQRVVLEEITRLGDYDTEATIRVETNTRFSAGNMTMAGTMFGNEADIAASWDAQRVAGTSLIARAPYRPQGRLALDSDRQANAVERSTALMLAHAVPVSADDPARAFRWFSSYDGQFRDIELQHLGTETITVPAGTFDTYKLAYRGGAPSQTFYITRDAPHRTVRIDIVAMPWRYELTAIN